MRILSVIVALPIIWTTLFPQIALAETGNTNTEIKFETQEHLILSEGIMHTSKQSEITLENKAGYQPVQTAEELKREKILARWKKKQVQGKTPAGKFTINASAYTAAADECGKSDGITASGIKVQEKRTLACPPNFPFGTKIQIEGMGTRVCEDRGGAIKGNHIDIYVETKKEAFAFGRRNLEAEVVN